MTSRERARLHTEVILQEGKDRLEGDLLAAYSYAYLILGQDFAQIYVDAQAVAIARSPLEISAAIAVLRRNLTAIGRAGCERVLAGARAEQADAEGEYMPREGA